MNTIVPLLHAGYEVLSSTGIYCTASRDGHIVLLRWRDGGWIVVG